MAMGDYTRKPKMAHRRNEPPHAMPSTRCRPRDHGLGLWPEMGYFFSCRREPLSPRRKRTEHDKPPPQKQFRVSPRTRETPAKIECPPASRFAGLFFGWSVRFPGGEGRSHGRTDIASERSASRHYAGNRAAGSGRAAWLGGNGRADSHPLFPVRPDDPLQSDILAENSVGTEARRRLVYLRRPPRSIHNLTAVDFNE